MHIVTRPATPDYRKNFDKVWNKRTHDPARNKDRMDQISKENGEHFDDSQFQKSETICSSANR